MITIRDMTEEELNFMVDEEKRDRARFALSSQDLEPLRRYVFDKIKPGGFLTAILTNDLKEAMGRADSTNRRRVFEYVEWLYNQAPHNCWGSPERVSEWLSK